MMETVSHRGGFVWHYSSDLSQRWGELPARPSQVWVQPPSTPSVGLMLLDAYRKTGNEEYLKYAENVAAVLIWGQLPSGGWHYFIDFDSAGVPKWYEDFASKWRGWEEFYHYYGNATFDDDTTVGPSRFLLQLYKTTLHSKYKVSVIQALDFIVKSQYLNGAWPQRYPPADKLGSQGHADYTSFYTFNDDVISSNIYLLLEAHEALGNDHYEKTARKGMDFYRLAQLPEPQAGWAEQYDLSLKPARARTYEPASVCLDQTLDNIKELQNFYLLTGDRRYLDPVPAAIRWIERSMIRSDPSSNFTHANFYEVGTNKPLIVHHDHRKLPNGKFEIVRYWADSEFGGQGIEREMPASSNKKAVGYHLGAEYQDSHAKTFEPRKVDLKAIQQTYEEYLRLPVNQAKAQHGSGLKRPLRSSDRRALSTATPEELRGIIGSLDDRGAWLIDIEFLDSLDFTHNQPTAFRGIDTGTYISNMYKLMNALSTEPLNSRRR